MPTEPGRKLRQPGRVPRAPRRQRLQHTMTRAWGHRNFSSSPGAVQGRPRGGITQGWGFALRKDFEQTKGLWESHLDLEGEGDDPERAGQRDRHRDTETHTKRERATSDNRGPQKIKTPKYTPTHTIRRTQTGVERHARPRERGANIHPPRRRRGDDERLRAET